MAEFLKPRPMKTTAISLELGQTRILLTPINPKITEGERRGKGSERKNRQATVLSFFWRTKKQGQAHSQTLTQRHLFLKNPGRYVRLALTI